MLGIQTTSMMYRRIRPRIVSNLRKFTTLNLSISCSCNYKYFQTIACARQKQLHYKVICQLHYRQTISASFFSHMFMPDYISCDLFLRFAQPKNHSTLPIKIRQIGLAAKGSTVRFRAFVGLRLRIPRIFLQSNACRSIFDIFLKQNNIVYIIFLNI